MFKSHHRRSHNNKNFVIFLIISLIVDELIGLIDRQGCKLQTRNYSDDNNKINWFYCQSGITELPTATIKVISWRVIITQFSSLFIHLNSTAGG